MNGFPHRCVGVIFMPLFRPFRAGVFVTIRPRALPWAITFSPVGAEQGQVGGSYAVPLRRWPVCPVAAMARVSRRGEGPCVPSWRGPVCPVAAMARVSRRGDGPCVPLRRWPCVPLRRWPCVPLRRWPRVWSRQWPVRAVAAMAVCFVGTMNHPLKAPKGRPVIAQGNALGKVT